MARPRHPNKDVEAALPARQAGRLPPVGLVHFTEPNQARSTDSPAS